MMCHAQNIKSIDSYQNDIIKQAELDAFQIQKTSIDRLLESGVFALNNKDYATANSIFTDVLNNSKTISSKLTFYFGKNSFYLKRYKQAIDWLSKYIELKGTSGQFYRQCVDLLSQANEAYNVELDSDKRHVQDVLSNEFNMDCNEDTKVLCPACKGKGVIIKSGYFDKSYTMCPYSDKNGFLTCEEYNLLLSGKLRPKF